jgi:Tfp pilus assembly protein PilO
MKRRRPLDARQRIRAIGIALVVLAALNLAFWLLFTRPGIRESERLEVGTDPQRKELLARRAEVEKQEKFLAQLQKTEAELKRLRSEVLSTRGTRMIGAQFEVAELCERFGVNWDTVSIDNELLQGEELDRMVMTVPLEGGYPNLRRFLQAVESSDQFLVVEQVGLAEAHEGGNLQLNVAIATYFDAPEAHERNRAEKPAAARHAPARTG